MCESDCCERRAGAAVPALGGISLAQARWGHRQIDVPWHHRKRCTRVHQACVCCTALSKRQLACAYVRPPRPTLHRVPAPCLPVCLAACGVADPRFHREEGSTVTTPTHVPLPCRALPPNTCRFTYTGLKGYHTAHAGFRVRHREARAAAGKSSQEAGVPRTPGSPLVEGARRVGGAAAAIPSASAWPSLLNQSMNARP